MEIRFVKAVGKRDRCWVTRPAGDQANWQFPSYGEALPHDLVHFAVETVFGLQRGLWGLVAAGADIGRVNDAANRNGGRDKYDVLGNLDELYLAEALATVRWVAATPAQVEETCRKAGSLVPTVTDERIESVRTLLHELHARWRALGAAGTLVLQWE